MKRRRNPFGRLMGGLGLLLAATAALFASDARVRPAAAQRLPAPEFPAGSPWLNTDRPLSMQGLRGKVVLLDFWTYGCINCMQILPDLERLEQKYPNELVVISVHTAKFRNEDQTENIRNAVLRYHIQHPILNDSQRRYWTALGVDTWPTFVLIDPAGGVVGSVKGEGNYATLDRAIGRAVDEARAAGILDSRPAKFALEAAKAPATPLRYPGKVVADLGSGRSDRIYIADTSHHRIVVATPAGEVQAIAGDGAPGRVDGPFESARFKNPQGMAVRKMPDGSFRLLVADTGSHCIRELDLERKTVSTIAGTGKQLDVTRKAGGGAALRSPLASPWDVLLVENRLYIGMAGPHQIWALDLKTGFIFPYAGSGAEGRDDGRLAVASFAQPSGLATDGTRLFVADSESSTIRAVDLTGLAGSVRTLVNGELFDFGDRDGPAAVARLQHPLGVAYDNGVLYIADTYNHKLKRLVLSTGIVETLIGGAPGTAGTPQGPFYEPGGLSLAGRKLYVADTNNHRIQVVDLDTKSVAPLTLKNLAPPKPAKQTAGAGPQ